MNDQENILKIRFNEKRDKEWEQIRLEMKAGSSDVIPKNNYFEDKSRDTLAEFETQDWQDEGEWIAQGWCEALEFAIKLIKRHNKSCEADQ